MKKGSKKCAHGFHINCSECKWDELGADDTVEQVMAGYGEYDFTPTNYWKVAFIALVLGAVVGMILSTPLFIKIAEVCTN
jgi:hypothetical protein